MFYHLPLAPSFSALFLLAVGLTESIRGGTLKCSQAQFTLSSKSPTKIIFSA